VSCTLKTFRGKQDHAQEMAVRQALGHPKTGDEITRTLKGKSPTSRKVREKWGTHFLLISSLFLELFEL